MHVVSYELPITQIRDRRAALEQRIRELPMVRLQVRPPRSRRPDPAAAAWVVVIALENVALRWVLDEPDISREAMLDEIEALVGGYARTPPRIGRTNRRSRDHAKGRGPSS